MRRWNRTTEPLVSPYRYEACTHHQAGSCTAIISEEIKSSTNYT